MIRDAVAPVSVTRPRGRRVFRAPGEVL